MMLYLLTAILPWSGQVYHQLSSGHLAYFLGGQFMFRRYRFEFILALVIVCGLITFSFWLH